MNRRVGFIAEIAQGNTIEFLIISESNVCGTFSLWWSEKEYFNRIPSCMYFVGNQDNAHSHIHYVMEHLLVHIPVYTGEPLIKDPPRKGHCMLDLSIKDTARGPKNYHSL